MLRTWALKCLYRWSCRMLDRASKLRAWTWNELVLAAPTPETAIDWTYIDQRR